jgi:hypothetical protein
VTGTTTRREGIRAANTVEVRGETLVVNVQGRNRSSMFVPTMRFPLDHVLGAEADPDIERKLWRALVLMKSKPGAYCAPDPDVRFYNPRHLLAHKAIVIRLRDETCERLVVEVEDPEGVVERVNRAVEAFSREASPVPSLV